MSYDGGRVGRREDGQVLRPWGPWSPSCPRPFDTPHPHRHSLQRRLCT